MKVTVLPKLFMSSDHFHKNEQTDTAYRLMPDEMRHDCYGGLQHPGSRPAPDVRIVFRIYWLFDNSSCTHFFTLPERVWKTAESTEKTATLCVLRVLCG